MKIQQYFNYLSLIVLFSSPLNADVYVEFSAGAIDIDTTSETTRPLLIDVRVGYAITVHQLELAVMSSVKDGSLNQLSVDVPSVVSLFYHYLPDVGSSIKLHLIVGASQVKVDSTYAGIASSSDSFTGLSYGIGFEESFKSMRQLKVSFDWIQLYSGDRLDIRSTSLGLHYVF